MDARKGSLRRRKRVHMVKKQVKEQVRENFSDAAPDYEKWARAQKQAAKILAASLPALNPEEALDLGCGTGLLTRLVMDKYPGAHLTGIDFAPGMGEAWNKKFRGASFINADIEKFRPEKKYGLITSSFTFQWMQDPAEAVRRSYSWLANGGVLGFCLPLKGSLGELVEAFGGKDAPILEFPKEEAVIRALPAGAKKFVREIGIYYKSPVEAVKSLKKIGAAFRDKPVRNAAAKMRAGLKKFGEMFAKSKKGYKLTYKVLFVVVKK